MVECNPTFHILCNFFKFSTRMAFLCLTSQKDSEHTAILIIIEGQFQVFERFSRSKLVLKIVESRFVALNYYENGSRRGMYAYLV